MVVFAVNAHVKAKELELHCPCAVVTLQRAGARRPWYCAARSVHARHRGCKRLNLQPHLASLEHYGLTVVSAASLAEAEAWVHAARLCLHC